MTLTERTIYPHPTCTIGIGAEHPRHSYEDGERIVTCPGWIEPANGGPAPVVNLISSLDYTIAPLRRA